MSDKSETRIALEARAEAVNVKFPANIGDEKLQEKVEAAEAELAQKTSPATPPAPAKPPKDGTVKVVTTGRVRWKGKVQPIGKTLKLDPAEAERLIARGVVSAD